MRPVALTVAGSDPSGGAGIQADLKTFQACGVYGAAVVTALTVQDTARVLAVHPVDPGVVVAQLDAVLDDLPVAATKTGLLGTPDLVDALAARLAARPVACLVVDPVRVATSGDALAPPATLDAIRARLLPLATLVTPNLAEAAALAGRPVADVAAMRDAARAIAACGARAVLVTGGHLPERACDVLLDADGIVELDAPRIAGGPLHGAGCTLSAAVTAGLAAGLPLRDAVRRAKRYVARAIAAAAPLGRGARPLDHGVDPDAR